MFIAVSRTMDLLYFAWIPLKAPVVIAFLLVRDRALQARFFAAYFALWIVGGAFAVLVPSLGPVYVHPEWFDGLAKPIATRLQQQLWTHYEQALAGMEDRFGAEHPYVAYALDGLASVLWP